MNSLSELSLLPPSDPLLKTKLPKFDFANPPFNPVELYNAMGKKLVELGGVGLAANQVGIPYQFFVIRTDPMLGFYNPKIVDVSEETIELEEGCLTFPGLIVKVKRPREIRIRFAEPTGVVSTKVFKDMTARVIQHEMDHLNGLTLGSRVSRLKLEMSLKKLKKDNLSYRIGDLL
jgi:peptide deformylase